MQTIPMETPVEADAYQIGNVSVSAISETFDIALRIGQIDDVALDGTVSVIADTDDVVGTGTAFETDLEAGQQIKIADEVKIIASIEDDTHLTLVTNHTAGATDVTAYRRDFVLKYEKMINLDSSDYQDLKPQIEAMVVALIPKIDM